MLQVLLECFVVETPVRDVHYGPKVGEGGRAFPNALDSLHGSQIYLKGSAALLTRRGPLRSDSSAFVTR